MKINYPKKPFLLSKSQKTKIILTLTRCCTQNCEICAVDAVYGQSIKGCADLAYKEQLSGRALSPDQWCTVVRKLLSIDPFAEFDLSGGDCLALPWVSRQLIPFILERVQSRKQLSVTSTALSLKAWLNDSQTFCQDKMPGTVHVTFDGCRQYSFENIRIAPQVRMHGMDIHAECPLTVGNCDLEKVREIYYKVKKANFSEILLMRFFPVGRGAGWHGLGGFEPSAEMYRIAIAEFYQLAAKNSDGPTIKVQCALKEFSPQEAGTAHCKMGNSTWCIMPNGVFLICPWAYGEKGRALHDTFVAGNIFLNDYEECRTRARDLRKSLARKYPGECRIHAFVTGSMAKKRGI